jgi:hypothetical protein
MGRGPQTGPCYDVVGLEVVMGRGPQTGPCYDVVGLEVVMDKDLQIGRCYDVAGLEVVMAGSWGSVYRSPVLVALDRLDLD